MHYYSSCTDYLKCVFLDLHIHFSFRTHTSHPIRGVITIWDTLVNHHTRTRLLSTDDMGTTSMYFFFLALVYRVYTGTSPLEQFQLERVPIKWRFQGSYVFNATTEDNIVLSLSFNIMLLLLFYENTLSLFEG